MTKNAILGVSHLDVSKKGLLETSSLKNYEFISLNYSNYVSDDTFHKYINHQIIKSPKLQDLPKKLSCSWYRDKNGIDNYMYGFSFGIALQRRLSIILADSIKYFLAFKELDKEYNNIFVPENNHEMLNIIQESFQNFSNQDYYSDEFNEITSILNGRGLISDYPINKLSPLMFRLQNFFMINKKNKILVFPDWTYSHHHHDNYLHQNSKNINTGFYFRKHDYDHKLLRDSLPSNLKFNYDYLMEIDNNDLSIEDKDKLQVIFSKLISLEYEKTIDSLCRTYLVFEDLLTSYMPSQIICPTLNHPWHTIIAEIARKYNIKTNVVLDGYATFIDENYYSKDAHNDKYLFDNYVFTGSLSKELTCKYFPDIEGDLIKPPLINLITSNNDKDDIDHDALIMMPYPWSGNPNSCYDQRYKYILEVIKILTELSYSNISIKIKKSKNISVSNEEKKLYEIIEKNNYKNIKIISGDLNEIIHKTKLIIGQAGTSLIESNIAKVPFFIYEPVYIGLSNENIDRSVFANTYFARELSVLSKNIEENKASVLDINKLNDGPDLTEIIT